MITLQAGDVFAVNSGGPLSGPINFFQKVWAQDGESTYNHAGIIQNKYGLTLEALWSIEEKNFFQFYSGCKVIVARPLCPPEVIAGALARVREEHLGQKYPAWRLALHIIPPLARAISMGGKFVVCSELNAKLLWYAGLRHKKFTGTNPDTLADEWREWKSFDVLYEAKLP